MKDKVQLIKKEIERRVNLLRNGDADPEVMKRVEGVLIAYNSILQFIDSLPEEPKFKVGDMVISTNNPSLTYKVLQVGLPNELGKLDYEVEIFTNEKPGIKAGNTIKEHNIHLISCDRMDEWGKLIPEEPASEDEKIRKALIEHIKANCETSFILFREFSPDSILAWLEKQGEQKPTDKVDRKGMNIVEEDMTPFQKKVFYIIDTTIEEEQGLKQVCDELLRLAHDEIMQNPVWSEGDEEEFQIAIDTLVKAGQYDSADWLKSLKERYTWKPSDEQMKALKEACDEHWEPDGLDPLYTLWEQLKKLTE